ncbi:hypothetical protein DPMN_051261 [Dreissena polymorpha]|uniref:Uncharacterized protein n=1 Tax=Dreissena polymorpha TaxID=45954 RepID=A0A9D4HQ37_DREPO|nr:hypothetical protein DPMN_051261 [Dreissena polymorpha]
MTIRDTLTNKSPFSNYWQPYLNHVQEETGRRQKCKTNARLHVRIYPAVNYNGPMVRVALRVLYRRPYIRIFACCV